ncbi:MAG: glycosyltransferase family 39 protein [Anaerolineaceae bacterium]|nr:glycosyltransferase family 39 protein [Anaerolineaceae bacterium]
MKRLFQTPWFWPLLVIVVVILATLPVVLYPLGRDQGMYANIGRSIVDGGMPYISMWDIKPPPIYYLYAAAIAVLGPSVGAVRALDLMLMPIALLATYLLSSRLGNRRTGLFAALFLGVFYFSESFENLTQSDSLALVPTTLAAWTAYLASTSDRASRRAIIYSLLTGLLCGVLLWFKQYYAFFVLALVIHQIWQRRALPIKEALAFAIGGLLTGGTILLIFASQGILNEMLIVAQGTAAYNAQGYALDEFLFGMGNGLMSRWLRWSPVMIGAVAWFMLAFARRGRPAWRLIWLWMLAALAFLLIQAKGFDTHWLPLLPPMCLFTADVVDWLIGRLLGARHAVSEKVKTRVKARHALPLQTVLVSVITIGVLLILIANTWIPVLPWLTGQATQHDYYSRFVAGDLRAAESLDVVQYLQERLAPDDSIFIYGFRPEVAFMGQWRPATRFQAQFPLVAPWYPVSWREENVSILWGAMPPYVLILQSDYMPWVTNYDMDSHQLLQDDVELNNWLMANYERETMIGNFFVWHRRTS